MNTTTIHGNASVKSELGSTHNGDAAFTFSVADTLRKKVDNEWVDGDTIWYKVSSYRNLAEKAAQLVPNGQYVTVTGRITGVEVYNDREGVQRSTILVEAEDISLNIRLGLK